MAIRALTLSTALALAATPALGQGAAPSATVQAPAFELPYSAFASLEARQRFADMLVEPKSPPDADVAAKRRFYGKFNDDLLVRMRRAFSTQVVHDRMGGVPVDVVTPTAGVRPEHRDKVLINLHGGGFMWGAGAGALLESIPIAATGGYKVVAVDYRLAPEHHYPAASEDAAAVYRELLKTYRPQDIGIYGCSAGGMLTAQATAWFQTHGLPRPGAIGTFCGSGIPFVGDSAVLGAAAAGDRPSPAAARGDAPPMPYLAGVPASDPEAYPANSPAVLARFPPTLLITGSRDFAQSAETTMHRRLVAAGVDARLFVFDGMPHAFFIFPDMPESHEVYGLVSRFFDRELGRPGGR